MIVKVQRSIFPKGQYLIYNEDRTVLVMDADPSPVSVVFEDLPDDVMKVYCEATLSEKGVLSIGELVSEQDW